MTVIAAPLEEINLYEETERFLYWPREHFALGSLTVSANVFHGAKIVPEGAPLPYEMGPPADLGQPILFPPFLRGLVYWTGWWMGDPPFPNGTDFLLFPIWYTTEGKLRIADEVTPDDLCHSLWSDASHFHPEDPTAYLEFAADNFNYQSSLAGLTEVPRAFWFALRDIGMGWRDDDFDLPPPPCPL